MNGGGERLFVAVPLEEDLRRRLAAVLVDLPPPGRPVAPGNWHLTLRFLGDTPADLAERIHQEIEARELGPPPELALDGFGAFPRPARARSIWAGVDDPSGRLSALAVVVEAAARTAGFPAEERPFRAHLTLSRLRNPGDVRPWLAAAPAIRMPFMATEVVLFRSELGSGPARYHPVRTYRLGDSPPASPPASADPARPRHGIP
jgi:RNA 2',3'-cyclic 3'-phosphodiesterase